MNVYLIDNYIFYSIEVARKYLANKEMTIKGESNE
jgi:hypothetical protein